MTLVELRKNKCLTQFEVASKLEIGTSTYNLYENGKRQISLSLAEKIAKIFEVDISDIFLPSSFMIRQ